MGGFDSVSNLINSNKKNVEVFLTALIVVSLMPDNVMGVDLKSQLRPLVQPIVGFMRHTLVQFLIFVFLLWSCCVKQDMNMFLLLCVFLLSSRQ